MLYNFKEIYSLKLYTHTHKHTEAFIVLSNLLKTGSLTFRFQNPVNF